MKNGHLTDQQLLFYVDGELRTNESTRCRAHLEACWTCRAELDDLQGIIKKIANFRNNVLLPMTPLPPRHWDGLEPRMRELGHALAKRSIIKRLRGLLRSDFVALRYAVSAFLVLVLLALVLFRARPTLSASELLARVQEAQTEELRKVAVPVIHQKLQIRRKLIKSNEQMTLDYDSWGDQSHGRFRQTETSAQLLSELRTIYNVNHLDWQAPLSAFGYARWRDLLPTKQDYVASGEVSARRDSDAGSSFLALTTVAGQPTGDNDSSEKSRRNVITKAELEVRTADWHPVEEHVFVDDREFEISELDYRVLPLSAVDASVFAELPPTVEVRRPHLVTRVAPPLSNPEQIEVLVRYKLHQLNADVGEPIEISRDDQGKIIVDASRASPELQAKLKHDLAPMSNTELREGETASATCQPCPATSLAKSSSTPVTIVPAINPNEKRLEEIFGDLDAKESFTQEVLAVSGDALSRSIALRDLALRYPPEVETRLGPEWRARLEEMVSDHMASLSKQSSRLQGLLRPLLEDLSKREPSGISSGAAAPSHKPPDEGGNSGGADLTGTATASSFSSSQWQDVALRLFAAVQRADSLANRLLPNTDTAISADEAVPALRQALSDQEQELNKYQEQMQAPKVTHE
jgi:uncharacterized coiled-coil protein SlyX